MYQIWILFLILGILLFVASIIVFEINKQSNIPTYFWPIFIISIVLILVGMIAYVYASGPTITAPNKFPVPPEPII